jgi:hypothetical protein
MPKQAEAQFLEDNVSISGVIQMNDLVNKAHPSSDSYCLFTKISLIDRPTERTGVREIDKDITIALTTGIGDINTGVCKYNLSVARGLVFGRKRLLIIAEYNGGWSVSDKKVVGIPINSDDFNNVGLGNIELGSGTHLSSRVVDLKLYTLPQRVASAI